MPDSKEQSVSWKLEENIEYIKTLYQDCVDIKMQKMELGKEKKFQCFLVYIEVVLENTLLRQSAFGRLIDKLDYCDFGNEESINEFFNNNEGGVSDYTLFDDIREAAQIILTGNALLFVDGYNKAIKIADKGYPNMPVKETDEEKVVRGSNEGFTDSVKINTALIRRHLRSARLKVKEVKKGVRSNTNIDIVYLKDVAKPELISKIEERLNEYTIDGIMDSGVIEQLTERKWYSPFPEFMTTRKPDRASMALLEGRAVLLCDNSPVALVMPADVNSFLKTTDDYYNRFEAATFARIIRYLASFFAMTLPGLYLAVTNFHTQILPTSLLLAVWEARIGVPFPEIIEVLLMELSFELLREAGIRLPGALGNTIGIVGGLIIGQAAVDANLVSPIVVIIVAFTALCSFAIPNEEFAFAFRILKFYIIFLSAWLGYFGLLIGIMTVLIHLTKLKSFGTPYLMPFVAPELNDYQDEMDSIIRFPIRTLRKRPVISLTDERIKLRKIK